MGFMGPGQQEFTKVLDAVTTGTATAMAVFSKSDAITYYVEGSAGVASGAVTIEEASSTSYAGTWSSIGVVTVPVSSVTAFHLPRAAYAAVRVRVSTNVVGGTVTVWQLEV